MEQETKTLIKYGITVTLGGKPHELKKLPIAKSEEWRAKAAALDNARMIAIGQEGKEHADETLAHSARNNAIVFNHNPKYVTELVIAFCDGQGPLTADWIRQNAIDEEIAEAFSAILASMLPFEFVTGGTSSMQKLMTPSSPSPAP